MNEKKKSLYMFFKKVKNHLLPWHFEYWTRNLSSLRWELLIPLLHPQDWQLPQRSQGWGDLYVTAYIMEILSVASSEGGRAWRQAPQRGRYISKLVIGHTFLSPKCLSSSFHPHVPEGSGLCGLSPGWWPQPLTSLASLSLDSSVAK